MVIVRFKCRGRFKYQVPTALVLRTWSDFAIVDYNAITGCILKAQ